jgi:hypothetical protein
MMTWKKAVLAAMEALGGNTRPVPNQEIINYIRNNNNNLKPCPSSFDGVVSSALDDLVKDGKVQKVQHGHWRLI